MASNTSTTVTAADLKQVAADLAAAEHHLAKAVLAAGRLAGSGVCERVEGLPLELFIGLATHMTGADRSVLIGAGQVLLQMPLTARLFEQGAVSWSQVRRIVRAARSLRAEQRAELDERIAASAEQYGDVDAFGPDGLCDAVDAAADDLRAPRSIERREAAATQANFLAVQRTLLKRVQIYADYDEVSAAPIVDMLDAAAGQPHGCGDGAAGAEPAEPEPAPVAERPTRRGQQYADALREVAATYLGGGAGANRARPLINVFFDLSQFSVNNAGMIELNVRGPIPRISLAALDALSRDADCRAVLFDGKRPLAVSRKRHAKNIPSDVSFAVEARDMGDRWPGSNDPLGHTENHHITPRARGGLHSVDDIVRLSRRYHRLGHDQSWQMRLDPKSGMFTITRGKRTWRSLPRGTPLAQPDSSTVTGSARQRTRRGGRSGAVSDAPLPF